jgi:hypothetical protein
MKNQSTFKRTAISAAVVTMMAAGAAQAAPVTHSQTVVFQLKDLIADFDGRTYGPDGNGQYQDVICTASGALGGVCDPEHLPIPGDEAVRLYPIDSEFGFNVVPYALATQKTLDGIYAEGYAGNILDAGNIIGLEVSDAETDTFQVPAGMGTWCYGLGGASVKCSTEQYVVMEHVLTCHETVAYVPTGLQYVPRADPLDGTQAVLDYVEDGVPGSLDCATTQLDNNLRVHNSLNPDVDGKLLTEIDWGTTGLDPSNPLDYLVANESTVLDQIAVGADYSVTAKDDGKPLYRWGTLIKRPNDIRMYKRIGLPLDWKFNRACWHQNNNLGCRVTKAELTIVHNITNNPNDQLRPEDMENEGAFGHKPGYTIDGTYGANSRVSDLDCYEGDGDFIPAGVVLRNTDMAEGGVDALIAADTDYVNASGYPYGWSADLQGGYSNANYTTVDREPFEWSYDIDGNGSPDTSSRTPLDLTLPQYSTYTLLSGPRWRLTPGKFGQDLPALDIPNVNCAPPPYVKSLIKYDVGAPTQTVINLLDWVATDERSVTDPVSMLPVSPLTFTRGWVDAGVTNTGTIIDPTVAIVNPRLTGVTINGSPVSQDFDLTVYIKGDKKPAQIYNATLNVEYDNGL